MTEQPIFAGTDVGSSRTKVVLLGPDQAIIGHGIRRSGTRFSDTAEACLNDALDMAGKSREDIAGAVSTGYGRKNVPFAGASKTEIACHALGCYHAFPEAISIIDIGGQDNKIIKLDEKGRRTNFMMNRKCAAGTGAFLEEMAMRLDIPLSEMNGHAEKANDIVKLGSFCTVFSGTEVLENIRQGKLVPDIVKGIFYSIAKRVLEMDTLTGNVVMTGGVVAHNRFLVTMTEEMIEGPIMVPQYPQLTGAIGAALYAMADGNEKGA
ncbi:MAG: acyl-CoA dehydratase activase [Desulfobacteraceae bacterium]